MRRREKKIRLSVAVATFNEESNIGRCLSAVSEIADEIVIVDGGSTDKTVEIASKFGGRVVKTGNPKIFHINKQKAIDLCQGEWILQLDADEEVGGELREEIARVVRMPCEELELRYRQRTEDGKLRTDKLFIKHQRLLEKRDGRVGIKDGEVVAFFVPRRNWFLGKFLRYGGTYPDGVIRLFRNGKARLPCKNVHEQYEVDGRVGWLSGDLLHHDPPNFRVYLRKNKQYAGLFADELRAQGVKVNLINGVYYCLIKPVVTFLNIFVRHKGFLDGWRGLVWAVFSGLTWVRAWGRLVQS